MQIELTKEVIIDMLRGSQPDPTKIQPLKNFVTYSDQYGRYYWSTTQLKEMSIEELYELYNRIK